MDPTIVVVAALIQMGDRFLICQRPPGKRHAFKWEFPGGKVEPGEQPAQALARELNEELGIRALIGAEITRFEFQYPGREPILLIFFHVGSFEGEPMSREFARIAWEPAGRLADYDFLEGDVNFVRQLAAGAE